MKQFTKKHLYILIIVVVWSLFAGQYFFTDSVPYPSRFQTSFFPPWSSYEEFAGPVKNNAMPDIITQIYPWRVFSIEQLKAGSIPLWNPYSFSGTPHLANYQSAVLFPLNVLFFFFSAPFAWQTLVLLQPLLAGLFTYLFAKSLKISNEASTISSIAFMFSGFITTWMGYATLGYAILFLPLALFAVQKYSKSQQTKYSVLTCLTIPFSFFAGHLQISVYFLMMLIAFTMFKFLCDKNKKKYITLFISIMSGVLLTMPQLFPSYEFYKQTLRSDLFLPLEVIPWSYIPTMFSPDYFGNPVTRNDWFGHYAEWSSFFGVVPLTLFIFAFLSKKTKTTFFFISTAIISALLAFNTPFAHSLSSAKVPLLGTSAASRIIILFSFSAAIVSGFGFDNLKRIIENKQTKKIAIWTTLLFAIIASLWAAIFFEVIKHFDHAQIAKKNLILPTILLLSIVSAVYVRRYMNKWYISMLFPIALIVLTSFDMLRFVTKWMPQDPVEQMFPKVGVVEFYDQISDTDRTLHNFTAENSVYYHLPSLGGYDPLYSNRYGEFVKYVATGQKNTGERSVVTFPLNGEYTEKAINLLSTNYVIHKTSDTNAPWGFPFTKYPVDQFEKVFDDSKFEIYKNKKAHPRTIVTSDFIVEKNDKKILQTLFSNSFEAKKQVIIEKDPEIKSSKTEGTATITHYSATEIEITTQSTKSAILVISDIYYPGWNAYVNEEKKDILRADYTLRGVVVPEGETKVKIKYEPQSFTNGLILAGLGLVTITAASTIRNKKK